MITLLPLLVFVLLLGATVPGAIMVARSEKKLKARIKALPEGAARSELLKVNSVFKIVPVLRDWVSYTEGTEEAEQIANIAEQAMRTRRSHRIIIFGGMAFWLLYFVAIGVAVFGAMVGF